MEEKKGITMIALIIMITVILILVVTITVTAGNSIDNTNISAFAEDLKEVEEYTKIYYMQNGKFPVIDEKVYTRGEILQIVATKNKGKFVEELQLNNDDVNSDNEGTFYKLDLEKIDVEQTTRGIQKDEKGRFLENDIYIVAYPSMNVYYLAGLNAKGQTYFSLSSKITKLTKIVRNETVETGSTSITTSNGLIVKNNNKEWSNKFNLVIESNMKSTEQLFIQVEGGSQHFINTSSGKNVFVLNENLKTIYSSTLNQQIPTNITDDEISEFNNIYAQDRNITITKQSEGLVVAKVVIPLGKYENDLPGFTENISILSKDEYNFVTFRVGDITSGIKEVRYEYLSRLNDSGLTKLYYEGIDSFDAEYMKINGKKATLSSNNLVEIKVPKDIQIIQINIIDKAGNSSASITRNVMPDVYIGINEENATKTSMTLNNVVRMYNKQNINNATIEISTDGINYTQKQELKLESVTDEINKSTVICEDLVDVNDKVYVRLIVNYGENLTETRVKEIKINAIEQNEFE